MQVFITGATGFIGSNLVEAFNKREIEPLILRRETSSLELLEGLAYESVIGDILDAPEILADAMSGCDWVFHIAALSDYRWQDQEPLNKVNVGGTSNLLTAAKTVGIKRFIFTSSLSALGIPNKGDSMDESNDFNLPPERFPYGYSKYLAEIEVRKAVDEGLEAVILNPTAVVGPRGFDTIVGALVVEASKGRLRFYPSGGMNVVAVDDVVAGHIAAAERGRAGENYILAGDNITYREAFTLGCDLFNQGPPIGEIPGWILPPAAVMFSILHKAFGDRVPLEANQIRLAGKKIYADGSKAARELGISKTPFRIATIEAFEWFVEHGYLD